MHKILKYVLILLSTVFYKSQTLETEFCSMWFRNGEETVRKRMWEKELRVDRKRMGNFVALESRTKQHIYIFVYKPADRINTV